MVLGMGWDEDHRVRSSAVYWSKRMGWPVPVIAPNAMKAYYGFLPSKQGRAVLTPYPTLFTGYAYATNQITALWLSETGCQIPSAYADGMGHNNCGKKCVLAGLAQWAEVYRTDFDGYMFEAWMELQFIKKLGKRYTILRNQRATGRAQSLTLLEFASEALADEARLRNIPNIHVDNYPRMDFGVCTCFSDVDLLRDYVNADKVQLALFQEAEAA